MCFWETHELSHKTTATFNLNNMVYYDLSLSKVLWKTPHIFASLLLPMKLQTNNSGFQPPYEYCFDYEAFKTPYHTKV